MRLDTTDIESAAAGGAGGYHGVIEDGLDDGLLGFQIQAIPLFAQHPAGAGQLVDRRGVGGRSDIVAVRGDAGGDRVTGRDPLPRADRTLGMVSSSYLRILVVQ